MIIQIISSTTVCHGGRASRGSQIKLHGIIAIPTFYKELQREITGASFHVTDIPSPAIIGRQTSSDLKLFTFNFSIMKALPRPTTIRRKKHPGKRQEVHD